MNRPFFPCDRRDRAAVILDDDFKILSSQVGDDTLVDDLMANLTSNVVVVVADAECLSSCEEAGRKILTRCECKIPKIALNDLIT